MAQETLYELYFAHVNGNIIDIRDISHISAVEYDKYDEVYYFHSKQKGAADYNSIRINDKDKQVVEDAREILVAAHAKIWLPYPDEDVAVTLEGEHTPEEVMEAINATTEAVPTVQESDIDLVCGDPVPAGDVQDV